MAKNTSQSILMQVAFKAAVAQNVVNKEQILNYYDLLIAVHEERAISLEDANRGGGGGNWPKKEPKPLPKGTVPFTDSDGNTWNDFRAPKSTGEVASGHPEFKTTDFKESVWLYKQDGTPDDRGATLAAAADKMAELVSPM